MIADRMDREALEEENRRLREALRKLRNYAESVWFDKDTATDEEQELMDRSRRALAAEPASGEAKLEEFDGPIMATLVQNNAALRAQNAELVAERDAAREHGVQARLREKAAEDRRIHDTDALRQRADEATRAENAACTKIADSFRCGKAAAAIRARIAP